jgi:DNA modification methylase
MSRFLNDRSKLAREVKELPFIADNIEYIDPHKLVSSNRPLRHHSTAKLNKLKANLLEFGFVVPLIVDRNNRVIAGEARLALSKTLAMPKVPVIKAKHLNQAQAKAFQIADNKLVELSSWDESALKMAFEEVLTFDDAFELEITGFETAQIDKIFEIDLDADLLDKSDEVVEAPKKGVSLEGDLWRLGEHMLLCADATDQSAIRSLLADQTIDLTVTDPPYNVPINGHVRSKSTTKHREFVKASGEMTDQEFQLLLSNSLKQIREFSRDGALTYSFMDWRSIEALLRSGRRLDLELINLAVWNKTNGGMGSFYRSQHELCAIFKVGSAAHINNIKLGATGRYRTNVWDYPGFNSFGRNRDEALSIHPTVKPVAMIVDIIKDASRRGDIIFDPFGGSGTTIVAAQRCGRKARLIELDPIYVDTIIKRFNELFAIEAIHADTGLTWSQMSEQRVPANENANKVPRKARARRPPPWSN